MTELYDRGVATIDEEERFEISRQLAKFLFDHAIIIPTVSVFQVWPVGPEIDEWELVCCVTRVPSNLEYIPPPPVAIKINKQPAVAVFTAAT